MNLALVKRPNRRFLLLVVTAATLVAPFAQAATIWNGPVLSYTRPNGVNGALAANQDRMAPDLWLARSSSQGLYNARTEGGFTHFDSPDGTEWANGSLSNYASLTYQDWNSWAKGVNAGPPSTVGVNAVLHIIPDDIYLSIKFTSWTGGGGGGGFSYLRSSPIPEPSAAMLITAGLVLVARRWRR
jgi:hypothetical protein